MKIKYVLFALSGCLLVSANLVMDPDKNEINSLEHCQVPNEQFTMQSHGKNGRDGKKGTAGQDGEDGEKGQDSAWGDGGNGGNGGDAD